MADYVQAQYIKNQNFNLSAVTELAKVEGGSKFNRTGWTFKEWEDEAGNKYSDQQLTAFSTDTVDLTANWTRNKYQVTYSTYEYGTVAVTAGGVNIPSGSTVDYETELTVVATPNSGRKVKSLKINGTEYVSTETSEAVTVTYTVGAGAVSIIASFDDNHGTITYYPGY